jgi:hypothetical protein
VTASGPWNSFICEDPDILSKALYLGKMTLIEEDMDMLFFDRVGRGGPQKRVVLEDMILKTPGFKTVARGLSQLDQLLLSNVKIEDLLECTDIELTGVQLDIQNLNIFGDSILAYVNGGQFKGTVNVGATGAETSKAAFVGCIGRPGSVVNYDRDDVSEANTQNGINGTPGGGSF